MYKNNITNFKIITMEIGSKLTVFLPKGIAKNIGKTIRNKGITILHKCLK